MFLSRWKRDWSSCSLNDRTTRRMILCAVTSELLTDELVFSLSAGCRPHNHTAVLHNSLFFCYITLEGRECVCVCIYIALVLVDLHGVLHLRQCFHVGVAGLPLLTIKLLLIELLQRRREKRERWEGTRGSAGRQMKRWRQTSWWRRKEHEQDEGENIWWQLVAE